MWTKSLCRLLVLGVVVGLWAQPSPACPQASDGDESRWNLVEGSGSGSLAPLVERWMEEYRRLHHSVRFIYRALGSGGGIYELRSGTASFAATDRPVAEEELPRLRSRILEVPVTVHAAGPIYNLPQVPELRLSGTTLADIFLGKITKWDADAIARENPGVNLPRIEIKVVHDFRRRKGYPSTDVMEDYLSKVSPEFDAALRNPFGDWPLVSISYRGAMHMGYVHSTVGGFGYYWQSPYPVTSHYAYAKIRNAAGVFVAATPESLTSAAASAVRGISARKPDFRVSITNARGRDSYPIASFIWIVFPSDSADKRDILRFLHWVLTDGQKLAPKIGYGPLPDDLVKLELRYLRDGTR